MLLWPYACAALAMAPHAVPQHRCTPNYRHAPPAMEMQHMWAKAMGEMERKQTALTAQVDVACGRRRRGGALLGCRWAPRRRGASDLEG